MSSEPTEKEMLQDEINRLKDKISKDNCQTYIWDSSDLAPTEELEKLTRPVNNTIKHQPYFGENKMPLPRKNECTDQCASYAERLQQHPTSVEFQPEKCQVCFLNPSFVDNFEQKEMPWPPEKGQAIWCISATGVVHEKEYDTASGPIWNSLVMCYVNEGVADKALETLLKARGIENVK